VLLLMPPVAGLLPTIVLLPLVPLSPYMKLEDNQIDQLTKCSPPPRCRPRDEAYSSSAPLCPPPSAPSIATLTSPLMRPSMASGDGSKWTRQSGKASKRRQAGRGSEKSLNCVLELKIGEPSSLTIASERETRNSYSSILDSQVTRLLEASIQ
jgi:hypothetical protein